MLAIQEEGEYTWKAGRFSWLVNVNRDLDQKHKRLFKTLRVQTLLGSVNLI